MVREFALQMLRKLQLHPSKARRNLGEDVTMNGDSEDGDKDEEQLAEKTETKAPTAAEEGQEENMEDGQLPIEELVHTPYLPERIELPAKKSQVLQHVELLFALSVKIPEFLDE